MAHKKYDRVPKHSHDKVSRFVLKWPIATTVEPPVNDHPKMRRFSALLWEMVAYENGIKGSGAPFSCVRNTPTFYKRIRCT